MNHLYLSCAGGSSARSLSFVVTRKSHRVHLALLMCWLAFATFAAQAQVVPIDYYRMGEADAGNTPGNVATSPTQDSVGSKPLSLPGGPFYRADVAANAASSVGSTRSLDFFTVGVYGTAALLSTANNNFGLEAWVKPVAVTSDQIIAYNGDTGFSGWGIMVRSNGTYQALFGGVLYFGSAPATAGTWTHVAVVRDNGTATLYVNGVAAGSTTSAPNTPSGSFGVAAAPPAHGANLVGLVDEVRAFTFAPSTFTSGQLLLNSQRVTTTADAGAGSLRQALLSATAGSTITITATGTITLASPLPIITSSIAINGPGILNLTINGANANRVFFVDAPNTSPTITGLTIAQGVAKGGDGGGGTTFTGGGGLGAGGGLFVNAGNLVLSNVNFSGNGAAGGNGGNTANVFGGGGGGGLGGNGGIGYKDSAGGGGGYLGAGGNASTSVMFTQYYGGGGGGGGLTGAGGAGNLYEGGGGGAFNAGQTGGASAGGAGADGLGGDGGTGNSGGNGNAAGLPGLQHGGGGGGGYGQNPALFSFYNGGNGGTGGVYGGGGGACEAGGGGNGGDFGGGGGLENFATGNKPIVDNGSNDGKGGFGGGGGGGGPSCSGNPPSPGYVCYSGSGGFGAAAGGAWGNAGTSGAFAGAPGTNPNGNGAAGGGGAALGAAIFVRGSNGATLTWKDGSVDAGNLTAGLGGAAGASFSTPGSNGSACGTSMFLLGNGTTLSVSSGTQTIAGSICGWTGALPGITKTGNGTLVLASALNSNLGPFEISAGELRVNGALASVTVQVDNSAVLSGTGSATGSVTLLSGAQMSPGDASVAAGIGTLDVGTLTWNGGATMAFQLGATNSAADSDQLLISGDLVKSGSGFQFNFTDGAAAPVCGTLYTLLQVTGNVGFSASDFSYTYSGANNAFSTYGTFAFDATGKKLQFRCLQPQTISFTSAAPTNATPGVGNYVVTATATSGLPVVLTIDGASGSVCTINANSSGSTVYFTGYGTCTIDANQPGNGGFAPAPQIQQSFNVTIGATNGLRFFNREPTETTAGVAMVPAVQVSLIDQYNHVVTTNNTDTATLAVANGTDPNFSGGGPVQFVNGVATFPNLTLTVARTGIQLLATTTAGNFTYTSRSFQIDPAAANHNAFVQQPSNVAQGVSETVQAAIEDVYNNITIYDNTTSITFAAPACGSQVTAGTAVVVNGVATFSDRFYSIATLNLTASSANATTATSSAFNVTANADLIFAGGFGGCRP